jgi:tetratricopeptide (TPR) repeat protein
VHVLYLRGKTEEAAALLRDASQRYPGHVRLTELRVQMAAAEGDYAAVDSLAELFVGAAKRYEYWMRGWNAAVRGQIGAAISYFRAARQAELAAGEVSRAADAAVAIGRLHLLKSESASAVAEVERFLDETSIDSLEPLDRPYLALASFFAEAERPRQAQGMLSGYDREVPRMLRGPDSWRYRLAQAAFQIAREEPAQAISDLERMKRDSPLGQSFDDLYIRISDRPEYARVYDRAAHSDSAIVTYERYLASRSLRRMELDAFELPNALFRLGELLEARGNPAAAAGHYRRFADLWKDADADLRPRVEAARRRAATLGPRR